MGGEEPCIVVRDRCSRVISHSSMSYVDRVTDNAFFSNISELEPEVYEEEVCHDLL